MLARPQRSWTRRFLRRPMTRAAWSSTWRRWTMQPARSALLTLTACHVLWLLQRPPSRFGCKPRGAAALSRRRCSVPSVLTWLCHVCRRLSHTLAVPVLGRPEGMPVKRRRLLWPGTLLLYSPVYLQKVLTTCLCRVSVACACTQNVKASCLSRASCGHAQCSDILSLQTRV